MNEKQQKEQELKHLHQTIDKIEECYNEAWTNEDGDTVLAERHATQIKVLLEFA